MLLNLSICIYKIGGVILQMHKLIKDLVGRMSLQMQQEHHSEKILFNWLSGVGGKEKCAQ